MTDIEKKQKKEKKVMTPQRLEQLAAARKRALDIRQAGAIIKMEAKIASITQTEQPEEASAPKEVTKKAPNFHPTPAKEIENKIIKAELVENPVTQEYVPEYSPRVEVQAPILSRQPPNERVRDASLVDEDEEPEEQPPPPPVKAPRKKERVRDASRIKTKIVIEQSSDDEDEFHPHEHVIFVKRKSKNDSKAKVVPAATPPPPTSPVRGEREHIPIQPQQAQRQLPTFPLENTMNDFVNAGFSNYRKYY